MIYTLSTSLALYRINRDRGAMMLARERRRAFWLWCGIVTCSTITTLIWIIYG